MTWKYEPKGEDDPNVVTLPQPARKRRVRRTMPVDVEVLRILGESVEDVHAYYLLRTWQHLGEEVTVRRYLREAWNTTDGFRAYPLASLAHKGLINLIEDLPEEVR